MTDKINARSISVVAALMLEGWALYVVGASPSRWRPSMIVRNEPAAQLLYETMIRAMHEAKSLSYTSICSAPDARLSTYRIWLKKPHLFRADQTNSLSAKSTTLLDDGTHLWTYWAGDRPGLLVDTEESREEDRSNVYVKEASLVGGESLCDRIAILGTAWIGLILDPVTFHGYTDPLEPYIDGIRGRGTNRVRGQECDVIEISFMNARRTRYIWLSREDHLPRKFKEIDRGAETSVAVEEWSNVTVNGEIPSKTLAWSPPQGWRQWNLPGPEDSLLRSGQEAPDFDFRSARGGRVRLSDYRGQVVWLYLWDAGSPRCRLEIPHLQWLHQEHGDMGLAILGFNGTDDERIARAFLRENAVTFPNVLDSSDAVTRLVRAGYGNKTGTLPLSYIIDPHGRVVDAWFGYEQDPEQPLAALTEAGL